MPIITLNRINIDYSNPSSAVKKLHDHVEELREQVSFALSNVDDNSDTFSIIKKTLNSQAGLILKATDSAASATLMASTVVTATGEIKAAEIIAAVNSSGSTVVINADKINLNGVTRMNGLAYVSQDFYIGDYATAGATRNIIFNDSARIRAIGAEITITGSQLNFGDTTVPAANVIADGTVSIDCGYSSSDNYLILQGRKAIMQTSATNTAELGGFTNNIVNIAGTLSTDQHVFLGGWDLSIKELAFVIKTASGGFRRFIITATREEII